PMFGALARRLFGSANDRYIKSLGPLVEQINEIEPELEKLSDEALRARTTEFKERLAEGAELDDLLVEAFATVREAAKRTLAQRQQAYLCDVTYGTNNELGFDYLRDNMKFRLEEMVHRPFHYAIVDEVDSILIDEARTPLIISGPTEDNSDLYIQVNKLIPAL